MQQTFNSMLGWMGGSSSNEPSASVLAEWQKYSGTDGTTTSGDGVMSSMEDGTARVGMFLSQSFKQVSSTVTEGTGGLQRSLTTTSRYVMLVITAECACASPPRLLETYKRTHRFQVPSSQQLAYFFAFMASGVFFLVLAFSVFLPLIIIAPAKFAFSFSIGGVLILSAFGALRGWQQQVQDMMSKERLPFSIGMLLGCVCPCGICAHNVCFNKTSQGMWAVYL